MDLGALRHKAARAVELELAKAYTAAYHAYLHAAEGFLEVARASRGADELRSMAARLMDRAERLVPHLGTPGTSTWEVSATDEWPLWSAVASDNVSVLPSPALSPHQLALCAHSRCSTAPVYVGGVGVKTGGLQQGAATDCSIVVALEMAAQHDACWGTQVRRVTSPLTDTVGAWRAAAPDRRHTHRFGPVRRTDLCGRSGAADHHRWQPSAFSGRNAAWRKAARHCAAVARPT